MFLKEISKQFKEVIQVSKKIKTYEINKNKKKKK